jgi:hypothetical protein
MLRVIDANYVSKAIRSVGTPEKNQNRPRLHHKFLIIERENGIGIWTGSFNITLNASLSLENAIYSEDPDLVTAYIQEFMQVLCLSSELNDNWEPEMYFTMRPIITEKESTIPITPLISNSQKLEIKSNESWSGMFGRVAGDFTRSFNDALAKSQPKVPVGSPTTPPKQGLFCNICLRNTHIASGCYAKTDIHGKPIPRK